MPPIPPPGLRFRASQTHDISKSPDQTVKTQPELSKQEEVLAGLIERVTYHNTEKGLRGIEWADLGAEGARKLCIS
jgi:hypothetical protein